MSPSITRDKTDGELPQLLNQRRFTFMISIDKLSPKAKLLLRKTGRIFGLDIRINGLRSRDDLRFVNFLSLHKIDVVFDVGANRGQFAKELFSAGYNGRVISFEPLPEAHAILSKEAEKFGERWEVMPRMALSDQNGTANFFVTGADTSSSLLEPMESFVDAAPAVKVAENIEVKTLRLDDMAPQFNLEQDRTFLKIDVQGSEGKVLAGAPESLRKLQGCLIEMSFSALYADQSSAIQVQQQMAELGFDLWDIWPGYRHPKTLRLNQVDALFFKVTSEEDQ